MSAARLHDLRTNGGEHVVVVLDDGDGAVLGRVSAPIGRLEDLARALEHGARLLRSRLARRRTGRREWR